MRATGKGKKGLPWGFAAWNGSQANLEHLARVRPSFGNPAYTRCGAKTRAGTPCRQPAMANGRCRVHGGTTPRGDQWHRVQFPGPDDPKRGKQKLRAVEKRQRQRASRLAAMTDAEREGYLARLARRSSPGAKREDAWRQRQREAKELIDGLLTKKEG